MKYIVKGKEPTAFTAWKALANSNWQPTYDQLQAPEKPIVKNALMHEQGFICCYCERRLETDDSHVEHFVPQDQLNQGDPRHCGTLKDRWFDNLLLISPLDPSCEQKFSFTVDGHIKPKDPVDAAAIETIERLGLNIPKLRDLREKVIEPFIDGNMPASEMTAFVSSYLQLDSAGKFGEFWTTIKYLSDNSLL